MEDWANPETLLETPALTIKNGDWEHCFFNWFWILSGTYTWPMLTWDRDNEIDSGTFSCETDSVPRTKSSPKRICRGRLKAGDYHVPLFTGGGQSNIGTHHIPVTAVTALWVVYCNSVLFKQTNCHQQSWVCFSPRTAVVSRLGKAPLMIKP